MATFSENQVRQLFVGTASGAITVGSSKLGTIKAKADKSKETLWFEYLGHGGLISSDKIKIANIVSTKATSSKKMETPLNRFKVELDSNIQAAIAAEVSAGQDYILRLAFRQYVGMSDEDQYWKYGMVHAVAGMTSDVFYKTLAISLAKNVARDDNKLVKIYAHSKAAAAGKFGSDHLTEVTAYHTVKGGTLNDRANNWDDGSKTVTDIDYLILEEVEQPWVLGKIASGKIPMVVQPTTITVNGDDVIWGTVTEEKAVNKIGNGKNIADLEYFCMGERADLYRGIGWPNNIETKYMITTPEKTNYDIIDITYFYAGPNEDIQKSQKTLTIVMDNAGSSALEKAIAADINSVSGKPGLVEVFG